MLPFIVRGTCAPGKMVYITLCLFVCIVINNAILGKLSTCPPIEMEYIKFLCLFILELLLIILKEVSANYVEYHYCLKCNCFKIIYLTSGFYKIELQGNSK